MPSFSRTRNLWLSVSVLAIGACVGASTITVPNAYASVETYTDQVLSQPTPDGDTMHPVSPGELSLQDVLKAQKAQKANTVLQPPVVPPALPAAAPLLKPPASTSSTNVMMMQGLKSALQQGGGSNVPTLKPPVIHHDETAEIPAATVVSESTPTPTPTQNNAVVYEPGRAPKSLGALKASPDSGSVQKEVPAETVAAPVASAAPTTPSAPAAETPTTTVIPLDGLSSVPTATTAETPEMPAPAMQEEAPTPQPAVPVAASESMEEPATAPIVAPQPTAPESTANATAYGPKKAPKVGTSQTATADCQPKTTGWVKSCVEAGYPANFTGEIRGETRTTCPDSGLHDVWVTNNCAAPTSTVDDTAPLSAPLPQSTQAGGVATTVITSQGSQFGDASCGAANGLAADAKPSSDLLCNTGTPSDVTGEGPWRWSCKAANGGITVSCAAPVAPRVSAPSSAVSSRPQAAIEDGLCGASDGTTADRAPSINLCANGVASRVSGEGPWNWACSGINGGQAVSCSASRRVDGVCGSSSGTATDERPSSDLCSAGYASAVTGTGPWNWTCSGLYGGGAATCSAAPRQDAVCGGASLKGHRSAPVDELCSVGEPSRVIGIGPWNWTCSGSNGGSPVTCESPVIVNGSCGSANGVAVAEAPNDNLCRNGKASRVTGVGPWQWNCLGTDSGDTESCTAPRAPAAAVTSNVPAAAPVAEVTTSVAATTAASAVDLCGSASELAALAAPENDLCKSGSASGVSGSGPWNWTCTDDAGHTSSCSTLSPNGSFTSPTAALATPKSAPVAAVSAVQEKAVCGAVSGQGINEAPTDGLCTVGKASKVHGSGPWDWSCLKGKSKTNCEAFLKIEGACGPANGMVQRDAPATGLCATGTATDIHGTGPWLWSCVGAGGGASSSCSAQAQSQTRVDGSCGAAANAPISASPTANLCDSGVASNVYGEGPWTWTCSGMNGGIAASCSAQRNIPPAPPPPGPPVNGLCGAPNGVANVVQPMDGLCTGGTATAVSGQGPWNWNCLGENGGMTVSCTSPLQPPAPITGTCGNASGVPTLTPPRSSLCSAGISSAVSGQGPWTWSCSGTNGGGAVGCVAPLAGTGNVGSLPSLVSTPAAGEAPAPQAAPMASVRSGGLVTPRLPNGTLPPLDTGTLPQLTPSKAFDNPPEPSAMPPVPAPDEGNLAAPSHSPELPSGTTPLTPPPIRDTLPPSPADRPIGFDQNGKLIPGNHFKLDDDISMLPFTTGSDNFDVSVTPELDKLVSVLQTNSGVRITLTSYAQSNSTTSPREARRLSLSRALAVRDYLTAKGISSARIDVRALGANVPSGDPDRVDIKAN